MSKPTFAASTVRCTGFNLVRKEGEVFYTINKANVERPLSPHVGFVYKNATDGTYVVRLGLKRHRTGDFTATKLFIKEKLAA